MRTVARESGAFETPVARDLRKALYDRNTEAIEIVGTDITRMIGGTPIRTASGEIEAWILIQAWFTFAS